MLQSYFIFLFLLNLTSNPSENSSQSKGNQNYFGRTFFCFAYHVAYGFYFLIEGSNPGLWQ